MSSIAISNQTPDSLKITLSKSPETDAYFWMTINLPSGRTESIIVTPPRYGFHISYKDPNNPGREIRSNSIRFSQAKLGIAVRRKPDNKIMVQATEEDLPDQMIRVLNETGLQVTAHVTQNDKNVAPPHCWIQKQFLRQTWATIPTMQLSLTMEKPTKWLLPQVR